MSKQYLELLSEALVGEIKAEMGRQDVRSTRELGRLIGRPSSYMSDRLDGGSPKTGRRVVLTVKDLVAVAFALKVAPTELLKRAQQQADLRWLQLEAAADGSTPSADSLAQAEEILSSLDVVSQSARAESEPTRGRFLAGTYATKADAVAAAKSLVLSSDVEFFVEGDGKDWRLELDYPVSVDLPTLAEQREARRRRLSEPRKRAARDENGDKK